MRSSLIAPRSPAGCSPRWGGCKPGDLIPGEERLIERATQVRDHTIHGDVDKAYMALAMLEEIGGL